MLKALRIKRSYESPSDEDGVRVLVDRLWPRGVAKDNARINEWYKELAPSTKLRQWFGHDPARWDEFERRYRLELSAQQELIDALIKLARKGAVTLVYAAKDEAHNNAVALRNYLLSKKPTRK